MDLYRSSDRKFRTEIEGLRAVAAFLVATYHIWLGRVSGGVDVFFVVSGFLITTSLLNRYERNGKIDFFGFITRLSKRLFPAALIVLFISGILSIFLLPQLQWEYTIKELLASALYFENWQLALNSVDYLAENNASTPFQHFWAMSIQGQFYIIWPALLFISTLLARYVLKRSVRFTFLFVLIIVFISSITYSIYLTNLNQPWAYFHTFTRVWEFSIGGLVALLISNVALKKGISVTMGWLGLIGLISCGIILQVSTVFPGYAALWPTLCAVFILLAGNRGGKFGVHRLLSSKLLVKFGGISYGFYLWHWPVLIFYHHLTGSDVVPLLDGIIIMGLSALLAYLTIYFIEKPIRNLNFSRIKSAVLSASFVVPVLILSAGWGLYLDKIQESTNEDLTSILKSHPGATFMDPLQHDVAAFNQNIEFIPSLINVKDDIPISYNDGCHQTPYESEVVECEYGNVEDPSYTIALIGGSHSAHLLPAFMEFAEVEDMKLLNYTKSGCRFTTIHDYSQNKASLKSCEQWNEELMDILEKNKPDLVITTANATEKEEVPPGYIEKWEALNEEGIKVLAIRDNPRFSIDIPTCVEQYGEDSQKCSIDRNKVLPPGIWEDDIVPENVYYTDLTDYYCEEDVCKPIVGNVLVYRDKHHITATFAKTLSPILREEVIHAIRN